MSIKITIPEHLSEIKLKDYQKYEVISENVRKETKVIDNMYQFTQEQIDFLNIKAVEIYCKINKKIVKVQDIRNEKARDYEDILNQLTKTLNEKTNLVKFFKYQGVEYGFQPDLDNMSLGELIDLDSYIYKPKEFHKALAVLYRPCKKYDNDMYTIEKYKGSDKYSDVMKEISADIFVGAQVFFYNLGRDLAKSTLASLDQTPEGLEVLKTLEENGGGITQFMHLLEVDLLSKNTLPKRESMSA